MYLETSTEVNLLYGTVVLPARERNLLALPTLDMYLPLSNI